MSSPTKPSSVLFAAAGRFSGHPLPIVAHDVQEIVSGHRASVRVLGKKRPSREEQERVRMFKVRAGMLAASMEGSFAFDDDTGTATFTVPKADLTITFTGQESE